MYRVSAGQSLYAMSEWVDAMTNRRFKPGRVFYDRDGNKVNQYAHSGNGGRPKYMRLYDEDGIQTHAWIPGNLVPGCEYLPYVLLRTDAAGVPELPEPPKPKKEPRTAGTALRFRILERDGFRCRYCGARASDGAVLQVDHIHPASKGGKTQLENLITACFECNAGKRDRVIEVLP